MYYQWVASKCEREILQKTALAFTRAKLPHHYLLCTGWCWGARWQRTLIATCLIHQGILNIGIFMSFPFAFLEVGKIQVRRTVGFGFFFLKNTETKELLTLSKKKRERWTGQNIIKNTEMLATLSGACLLLGPVSSRGVLCDRSIPESPELYE